ncbi:tetratricopeptide repeat protein [candidate division WOR-3 bacterium]|nr:tetratricopeptide repeat protein [candidate division WOR-3 bacterium]
MAEEDIKKLERRYQALLTEPDKGKTGFQKVDLLIEMAHAHYPSNPEKTENLADQALALAEKLAYENGCAESNRILGIVYALKGTYDKALEHYHQAVEIFEETGNKEGLANSFSNIGIVYKNRGSYEQALFYQQKALENFKEIGDRNGVAYSYKNIGLLYDKRGSYEQALEYYLQALDIFQQEEDKKGIAVCCASIGVVYKKQTEYDEALEYYRKALEVFSEIGNKQFVAHTYNNIGIVYKNQSSYNQALKYYNKALKIFTEIGDKRGIANSYGNLGVIYEKKGDYEKSLEYYMNALQTFEEMGDKQNVAISYGNIGHVHTQLGHFDAAQDYLLKGLEQTQEIGAKEWEMHIYGYLSELFEVKDDFEKSLAFHKKFSQLKEKIFSDESAGKISQMKTRFEMEKKEKEAEIYRLRNVELEAEIVERRKVEEQIKASLEEKEVLLREVHHRVKNNLQVISSLLNLQSRYGKDKNMLRIFDQSQNRIESMALIHEKLYESEDLARIDLKEYLQKLTSSLFASYKIQSNKVALQINISDVLLGIEKAIPLALIINELISNSLQHAFPEGKKGRISIDLKEDKENYLLTLVDNGIGLPQDFDIDNSKSLGLRLVKMLVDQLQGDLNFTGKKGTEFNIKFPKLKPKIEDRD